MNLETLVWDVVTVLKNTHINNDSDITDWILDQGSPIMTKGEDASASDSNTGTDNSAHYDGEPQQFEQINDDNGFKDIELEDLVMVERPQ
jgi:hypothetical protein